MTAKKSVFKVVLVVYRYMCMLFKKSCHIFMVQSRQKTRDTIPTNKFTLYMSEVEAVSVKAVDALYLA